MAGRIFINYRRGDDPSNSGRLLDQLEGSFALEQHFADAANVDTGRDFVRELEDQISRCDIFLAVIGPRWLDLADAQGRRLSDPGDFVRLEIQTAFKQNKRVVPVLIGGAPMPLEERLPDSIKPLARLQAVSLNEDRFRTDTQALIKQLQQAITEMQTGRKVRPPQPSAVGRLPNARWIGAAAVVLLLVGGGAVWWSVARNRAAPAPSIWNSPSTVATRPSPPEARRQESAAQAARPAPATSVPPPAESATPSEPSAPADKPSEAAATEPPASEQVIASAPPSQPAETLEARPPVAEPPPEPARPPLDAQEVASLTRRAHQLALQGEYAGAKGHFDEILLGQPQNVEALNDRCWVVAMLGELEEALKDCDRALELRPNYFSALDSRGLVHLKLGKLREAIADYDAALAVDARLASSLYGRGVAKRRLGAAGGDADITRARQLKPGIVNEFNSYGIR
jgi:hypothetical protein